MPRRVLRNLKLNAIAAVDNPCQEGARMAIIKRRSDPSGPSITALAVAKYIGTEDGAHTFNEVLSENKFSEAIWPLTDAFTQSIRSIVGDKSLASTAREAKITTTVDEFLNAVRDIEPNVEKQLLELISKKDDLMPKTIEELTAKVAELTGQMVAANAQIATLTTEKAAAETAKSAAETAKAAAETAAETAKTELVTATDEVIKVGETEVRKSVVGEAQFTVLKAMRDERDEARFEKRASDEFPHVPGTVAEKAALLRHIEAMPEETKKAALAVMESTEKMVAQGFERLGRDHGLTPTAKAAEVTFMAKVAEVQKRDGIKQSAAMSKARTEFPEEFEAYHEASAG